MLPQVSNVMTSARALRVTPIVQLLHVVTTSSTHQQVKTVMKVVLIQRHVMLTVQQSVAVMASLTLLPVKSVMTVARRLHVTPTVRWLNVVTLLLMPLRVKNAMTVTWMIMIPVETTVQHQSVVTVFLSQVKSVIMAQQTAIPTRMHVVPHVRQLSVVTVLWMLVRSVMTKTLWTMTTVQMLAKTQYVVMVS
jgi:hypothetical protein